MVLLSTLMLEIFIFLGWSLDLPPLIISVSFTGWGVLDPFPASILRPRSLMVERPAQIAPPKRAPIIDAQTSEDQRPPKLTSIERFEYCALLPIKIFANWVLTANKNVGILYPPTKMLVETRKRKGHEMRNKIEEKHTVELTIGHNVMGVPTFSTMEICGYVSEFLGINAFTAIECAGMWNGESEKSTRIEICALTENEANEIRDSIPVLAQALAQESIMFEIRKSYVDFINWERIEAAKLA